MFFGLKSVCMCICKMINNKMTDCW